MGQDNYQSPDYLIVALGGLVAQAIDQGPYPENGAHDTQAANE